MNIEVVKEDIKKIGNTKYNEGGFLAIVCDGDTSNIEEILLRTILKCFGDEYKVIKAEDDVWEDINGEEVYDILFITNLPYEIFEKIYDSVNASAVLYNDRESAAADDRFPQIVS
jgi:hypothetical protein